jgi:cation transport ATPase
MLTLAVLDYLNKKAIDISVQWCSCVSLCLRHKKTVTKYTSQKTITKYTSQNKKKHSHKLQYTITEHKANHETITKQKTQSQITQHNHRTQQNKSRNKQSQNTNAVTKHKSQRPPLTEIITSKNRLFFFQFPIWHHNLKFIQGTSIFPCTVLILLSPPSALSQIPNNVQFPWKKYGFLYQSST